MSLLNGNFHTPADLIPDRAQRNTTMPELPAHVRHDNAAADDACQWLNDYIDFSRLWAPRGHPDFHESCGLWLLSTVAARRIAYDFGKTRYTSLYIAIASRTSVWAKSTTADIAQDMLRHCGMGYLLASDDATPQAFVRSMTRRVPDGYMDMGCDAQEFVRNKIAFAGQTGWFFDEFGMKLAAMMREGGFMSEFRGLLRKFDDTPEEYRYDTISRGSDIIYQPYLALMANLTPDDLSPYARRRSSLWGDGFFARFAFLAPNNADVRRNERFPSGTRIIPDRLTMPLTAWHHDLGIPDVSIGEDSTIVTTPRQVSNCSIDEAVIDAYYRYNDALIELTAASEQTDLDGNYSRLPEKALRVAVLLGSLENNRRVEMKHWHRAQRIAEDWRRNLHNLYEQLTAPAASEAIATEDKIMQHIADKGPLTAREIVQGIHGLDTNTARRLLDSMDAAGFVEKRKEGRKELYCLAA